MLIWFRKAGVKSSKSSVIWSLLAILILVVSASEAFQTHQRSGFLNGVLFAINCIVSPVLAVAVVYPFVRKLLPVGVKRLEWAKNSQSWRTHAAPRGKVAIASSSKGLHFSVRFTGDADKWANMDLPFSPAQDFRGWAGIVFDIECDKLYPETTVTFQVNMTNGSSYSSGKPLQLRSQRALFLFQEMWWGDWSQPNPSGYLELREVNSIAVGCNTTLDEVAHCVKNFALVKFTDIPS